MCHVDKLTLAKTQSCPPFVSLAPHQSVFFHGKQNEISASERHKTKCAFVLQLKFVCKNGSNVSDVKKKYIFTILR